jgi:hypothetical protein
MSTRRQNLRPECNPYCHWHYARWHRVHCLVPLACACSRKTRSSWNRQPEISETEDNNSSFVCLCNPRDRQFIRSRLGDNLVFLAGQQEQSQDQPQPADQEQVNYRSVAFSDFNKTGPLLSRALHTPFPYGRTEFILPRARHVNYPTYIKHLIKFKDGRFAGNHLFPCVAFNTMMGIAVNSRSSYFSKSEPGKATLTAEDLREECTFRLERSTRDLCL